MAKLLDQRRAIRLLQDAGWTRATGGKHVVKMTKPGARPITLPHHHGERYGKRLSAAIITQAGLDPVKEERFASQSSSARTDRDTGRRSPSFPAASRQAEL